MKPSTSVSQNLQEWRAELLQRVLFVASVGGFPILIIAFFTTPFPVILLYLFVYLALLAITVFPVPYRLRAIFAVALLYLIGIGNFLENQHGQEGFMTFLALIALGFIWLDFRLAVILSGFTLLTAVFFSLMGLADFSFSVNNLFFFGIPVYNLIFLSVLIVFSAYSLLQRLGELFVQSQGQKVELETIRASLEEQVAERTAELERRTRQLNAAIQVTREAALERDITYLVRQVVTLIGKYFGYYHVGLFLLDETRRYAVLQAASSEEGQRLVERGHRLEVGTQGIVGRAAAEKRAYIAQDVELEEAYFRNPELVRTRSEIALPLMIRGEVIGVLDIQSEEPQAFRQDDIETLQSMADSIAMALENARLFSETQLTLQQVQALSAAEVAQAWRKFSARRRVGYRYTPLGVRSLEATAIIAPNGSEGIEIPLQLRGQRIGVLRLKRKASGQPWSEQEKNLAQQVADQIALALENARLLEETRDRAERERILAEIAARVRETLDIETILRRAADDTRSAFALPEVVIQILPEMAPESRSEA
ncbi:MAG: GAF domain-containing protein [Anaerolineales bacterium]